MTDEDGQVLVPAGRIFPVTVGFAEPGLEQVQVGAAVLAWPENPLDKEHLARLFEACFPFVGGPAPGELSRWFNRVDSDCVPPVDLEIEPTFRAWLDVAAGYRAPTKPRLRRDRSAPARRVRGRP